MTAKHMPIDVPSDKSLERKSVEKMVNSEELAFEDQPFVMTTKRSADTDIRELDPAAVSSTLNPNPNEVSIRDQLEAERIQFSSEPFDYDLSPITQPNSMQMFPIHLFWQVLMIPGRWRAVSIVIHPF